MKFPSFPIISLASPTAVDNIRIACSTWGAFVAIDHGIDTELQNRVLETGHDFFNLPTKDQYNLQKYGSKWRGYMPVGGERSLNGQIRDAKEGLYMGDEHDPNDPRLGLPTFGTNVFPTDMPEMKEIMTEYHGQMKLLGNRMMRFLATGLDLEEDYLEKHITRYDPVILPRMFRYLPQPDIEESSSSESAEGHDDADVNWGIGRHSDYGLWTMILTDAAGLEFEHPDRGDWHTVPFFPNSILMNVGDVLDRLSSGRFKSAFHRARNLSSTKHRLSVPFFYDPAWDAAMLTLPCTEELAQQLNTPERKNHWSNTKISCEFNGQVEYSEFLAKKVAEVFPDLVPESVWKSLSSTSSPSSRHALVVQCPDKILVEAVRLQLEQFYKSHPEVTESHGLSHVDRVYQHAVRAIASHDPPLSSRQSMEVQMAALLHDVDDSKYFLNQTNYKNAREILKDASVPEEASQTIIDMIDLVSCSKNGNNVPEFIARDKPFHMLIPRWADRLEAIGEIGVARCYQYNEEHNRSLSSHHSPRAQTEQQVWELATPQRFAEYQASGGSSHDMISHFYDKLLHVARPPTEVVRNEYLERAAQQSSKALVDMCLRFGRTGKVDEGYMRELANKVGA